MKLWKILTPVALCLVLVLVLVPFNAKAAATQSGTCGVNVTWTLDDAGTLTISGTGLMKDYEFNSMPWYELSSEIKKVVIEKGVTAIGDYAFYHCENMTAAVIPDSVTVIGTGAFQDCLSLTNVTIPDSVIVIGEAAFNNCGLPSVTIPDSVSEIGSDAFLSCYNLDGIWVDENNPVFSNDSLGVLYNKQKTVLLQAPHNLSGSYVVPDGVVTIMYNAFLYVDGLTSLTLPNSIRNLGNQFNPELCTIYEDSAYLGTASNPYYALVAGAVEGAETCNMHPDTKVIAFGALNSAYNLTGISIPDGVIFIGGDNFYMEDVPYTVYENAKYLGNETNPYVVLVEATTNIIGECKIHPDTKVIYDNAFDGCTEMTSVRLPSGLVAIGARAFRQCRLETVTIPASVINIDPAAFAQRLSTTAYVVEAGNPAYCTDSLGVLYNKDKTILLQAPVNLTGRYTIPSCVTAIGGYAFWCCDRMESVYIPAGVIAIGETFPYEACEPFNACYALEAIWVDAKNPAYRNDSKGVLFNEAKTRLIQAPAKLSGSYQVPETVERIYSEAFCDCHLVTEVKIPAAVSEIGWGAFYRCSKLTGIWVDENNAWYSSDSKGVLFNKSKTQLIRVPEKLSGSYTIPDTVIGIGTYSFSDCVNITELSIPYRVKTIELYAFSYLPALTDVYYGASQRWWNRIYIGEGNDVLEKVPIHFNDGPVPGTFTSGYYTYRVEEGNAVIVDCDPTVSGEIVIPETLDGYRVRTIDDYAFEKCVGLTAVTFPKGLVIIGTSAFSGCTGLTTVTVPADLRFVETAAFAGCENLADVYFGGDERLWRRVRVLRENEYFTAATLHFSVAKITGDVDGDGALTTEDAVYLLLSVMFGTEDYPVPAGTNLDFDGNGTVETNDAVYLLLHVMFGGEDYPLAV